MDWLCIYWSWLFLLSGPGGGLSTCAVGSSALVWVWLRGSERRFELSEQWICSPASPELPDEGRGL